MAQVSGVGTDPSKPVECVPCESKACDSNRKKPKHRCEAVPAPISPIEEKSENIRVYGCHDHPVS